MNRQFSERLILDSIEDLPESAEMYQLALCGKPSPTHAAIYARRGWIILHRWPVHEEEAFRAQEAARCAS